MASPGRPRKLNAGLADQLIFYVGLGLTREAAARAAGIGPRSLTRWLHQGQEELDALSPQAWLTLALTSAEEKVRQATDWRESALHLEELDVELADLGLG
jgi:hypothetical protein